MAAYTPSSVANSSSCLHSTVQQTGSDINLVMYICQSSAATVYSIKYDPKHINNFTVRLSMSKIIFTFHHKRMQYTEKLNNFNIMLQIPR